MADNQVSYVGGYNQVYQATPNTHQDRVTAQQIVEAQLNRVRNTDMEEDTQLDGTPTGDGADQAAQAIDTEILQNLVRDARSPTPVTATPIKRTRKKVTSGVFRISDHIPKSLLRMYTANPEGMARNIIEITMQVRIPKTVKTVEGLNQAFRRFEHQGVIEHRAKAQGTRWVGQLPDAVPSPDSSAVDAEGAVTDYLICVQVRCSSTVHCVVDTRDLPPPVAADIRHRVSQNVPDDWDSNNPGLRGEGSLNMRLSMQRLLTGSCADQVERARAFGERRGGLAYEYVVPTTPRMRDVTVIRPGE